MPAETPGQSGIQGLALPAATRTRLAWRPPALRAAQSLFSGMPASFPALARVNRLLEWHRLLAHRFRPWLGWAPSPLEFGAQLTVRTFREGQSLGAAVSTGVTPLAQRFGPREPRSYTAPPPPAQMEDSPERWSADTQPARRSHQIADDETGISGSGPFADEIPRGEAEPESRGLPNSYREEPSPFALPSSPLLSVLRLPEAPEVPRPRLRLSVSPISRREVTGVFPQSEPVLADTIMAEPSREKEITRIVANETSTTNWEAARQSIATAALRAPDVAADPNARSQTAIEKLIEQTRKPVPLPGLEIRVVKPSEREEGDQRRSADERDRATSNTPASPPVPPAPQLDINAVADKVYQTLLRRQQFERERKGFY